MAGAKIDKRLCVEEHEDGEAKEDQREIHLADEGGGRGGALSYKINGRGGGGETRMLMRARRRQQAIYMGLGECMS